MTLQSDEMGYRYGKCFWKPIEVVLFKVPLDSELQCRQLLSAQCRENQRSFGAQPPQNYCMCQSCLGKPQFLISPKPALNAGTGGVSEMGCKI